MIFGITTIDPQSGMVAATPQELRDQIVALAVASNPGLTTNLPGTLIEDIVSTDVAALYLAEQAKIETIASVSPYAANMYILNMLGQIYGVPQGIGYNASVYVEFSGTVGYVVPKGVVVSDGTYSYVTQEGSVIGSTGTSNQVYCVCTVSGTSAPLANTVNIIASSLPVGSGLTVNNQYTGTSSTTAQTPEDYRSQVLEAGLVACTGTIDAVKSSLKNVPGVVDHLISIQEATVSNVKKWKVLVAGGDSYAVANAIWSSIGDPNCLTGSSSPSRTITRTINDPPNTYSIVFATPLSQVTTLSINWKAATSVSNETVTSLANQPILDYVNSISPGQYLNIYEVQYIFQEAVQSVIPTSILESINVTVTIGGSVVTPTPGTNVVIGNSEGYYNCVNGAVTFSKL